MMLTKTGKFKIFIISLLLVVFSTKLLVLAADETLDPSNKGSISINLRDPTDDSVINAASFSLYTLAEPSQIGGEGAFLYTAAFKNCGIELSPVKADALAKDLAAYAEEHQLAAVSRKTSEGGRVCFSRLADGLYLIVQEGSVAGYYPASPFIVSLPLFKADGSTTCELEANPKIEKADTPEPEPEPPAETEPPVEPGESDPEEPRLIQTGQLHWPIPVLAAAGFILFTFGWPVFFKKENKKDEEDEENEKDEA